MSEKKVFAELVLSPEGQVYLDDSTQAREELSFAEFEKIQALFAKGSIAGLLHLGIQELSASLTLSFAFWQTFSRHFIAQVCKLACGSEDPGCLPIPAADAMFFSDMVHRAFFMRGIEFLTIETLTAIWHDLAECLQQELKDFSGSIQAYLHHFNPRWNLVGRVCFHLAENKVHQERPFAFLATYTTELTHHQAPKHLPLKHALEEYAGEKNKNGLLGLLLPVQKAATQSPFIKELVDTGRIFQPMAWTAQDAYRFLKDIPLMESSGIMIRVPNWWNAQKPPRPKVKITLGEKKSPTLGLGTLLDFNMELALEDGQKLTQDEWNSLLEAKEPLVKIKGQWVEVNREKLNSTLSQWNQLEQAIGDGLSMAEGLRLLAGGGYDALTNRTTVNAEATAEWSTLIAGDWLKTTLDQLKNPHIAQDTCIQEVLSKHLQGSLRSYQLAGVQWLWLLYHLKLGGCLADDMGLGKTIQVLSLFLLIKHSKPAKRPHLLIVPSSLLGNWQAEAARFAPSLSFLIVHSSMSSRDTLADTPPSNLADVDVVITTYAFVYRLTWFKEVEWDLIILDEAQLIKNPDTKQAMAIKALKSQTRFTLTGTPIENRLGDLWSLFDFTSPGLLGSSKVFSTYAKQITAHFTTTLRKLTEPYILRRLKSDKKIITDLPDKTEMQTFCSLSKEQIRLYQQTAEELAQKLEVADGIQRRGLVLSYLLRFKQICNHPAQCLGYGEYIKEESGKFIRLVEICEEIAAKQEKVLIFTQFQEIIPALCQSLAKVFGREGLSLHGATEVKKRSELVKSFQEPQGPPFFVLSLKAGGTGLNLTRASHVIHFDRWWNPAVENQATDRAYRIGQKNPVLVHKFICRGTIEEKIDALITSKKELSQEVLKEGSEIRLTELTNEELLNMISIDLKRALGD